MEPHNVLALLDAYWFRHCIFNKLSSCSCSYPDEKTKRFEADSVCFDEKFDANLGCFGEEMVGDEDRVNPDENFEGSLGEDDLACPDEIIAGISGKMVEDEDLANNPDEKIEGNSDLLTLPNIQTKASLEKMTLKLGTQMWDSASPNSVLFNSKLQTIFSGKEVKESAAENPKSTAEIQGTPTRDSVSRTKMKSQKNKKKKGLSKSLSDLEFEELKGFMDLGFVFSEEDKDSNLANIIPGLQRFGKKSDDFDEKEKENEKEREKLVEKCEISRPYLSESWEFLERRKKRENSTFLMKWKVPNTSSEIDMKDYLKIWAHTVASAVR